MDVDAGGRRKIHYLQREVRIQTTARVVRGLQYISGRLRAVRPKKTRIERPPRATERWPLGDRETTARRSLGFFPAERPQKTIKLQNS